MQISVFYKEKEVKATFLMNAKEREVNPSGQRMRFFELCLAGGPEFCSSKAWIILAAPSLKCYPVVLVLCTKHTKAEFIHATDPGVAEEHG